MIATIVTIAAIARKKRSAIVAIMRKPLFSDRSDHSYLMETSLYGNRLAIKVATMAQLFFCSDRSDVGDHMETSPTLTHSYSELTV